MIPRSQEVIIMPVRTCGVVILTAPAKIRLVQTNDRNKTLPFSNFAVAQYATLLTMID